MEFRRYALRNEANESGQRPLPGDARRKFLEPLYWLER